MSNKDQKIGNSRIPPKNIRDWDDEDIDNFVDFFGDIIDKLEENFHPEPKEDFDKFAEESREQLLKKLGL